MKICNLREEFILPLAKTSIIYNYIKNMYFSTSNESSSSLLSIRFLFDEDIYHLKIPQQVKM